MKTSVRSFASMIVLAIAMVLPSFAQTTLTKYVSPDGSFSVSLPGTTAPTVETKQLTNDAGLAYTQNVFSDDDAADGLRVGIVEAVYAKPLTDTAADAIIAFNRKSDAEVLASEEIADGQMEIINAYGMRALYIVILRGNELVAVLVATPKDSASDAQVPIVQGIYQSLKFTAPALSKN